jgi:excinuclease ABC subunit B
MKEQGQVVEQLLRPTGLVDPKISIRPTKGQIDDLLYEIREAVTGGGRVLITTLTKKMAENLTMYLAEHDVKAVYMHSDIDTLERINIITSLRKGENDVLVGINLLREGLDLPEVELVVVLDADKEGFLRSRSSLIQTVGRAARNVKGKVIFYADKMTDSMKNTIDETDRRRNYQIAYNKENNIVPKTIVKEIKNSIIITKKSDKFGKEKLTRREVVKEVERLKGLMSVASASLDFETCIKLREEIAELSRFLKQ